MSRYGAAGSLRGDPRWITARYPASCGCGAAVAAGERAWYWPHDKRVECPSCGETSEQRFLAEVADEFAGGGWG